MTIALCMIVRDEGKVIERCLDSVVGLCDSFVIVDTGSTDNTMALIDKATRGRLHGELHQRPWRDFAYNRTELMELAHGKADWLLLLDADMTVEHPFGPDHTLTLEGDSFMLKHDGEPEYWIKRLVRGDKRWYYIGVTHEYLACHDAEIPARRLDAITVHHHYDGGHRPEKFKRDYDLLAAEHLRDPDDTRTAFYLANTLRDLGRKDEAIAMYRQRAKMGGWQEEVFYSLYEAGRLGGGITTLFEAWATRPTRAEPLYELAHLFRKRRQWACAFLVANRGIEIEVPDDSLFLHRWIYDWGLLFELSICSWWAGDMQTARWASDKLLDLKKVPDNVREQVIANREWLPGGEQNGKGTPPGLKNLLS